jgi:hypothetical protein
MIFKFIFEAFGTELYQGPGKQLIVNIDEPDHGER